MPTTRDQIREFITTNFYLPDPAAVDDGASLIDLGVIDSTGVLEVIAFLESTFEITVTEADTVPDNLDSIARIVTYVERKQATLVVAAAG